MNRIFGLCGDQVNALYHAIDAAGIEIVGARHESAAVQMADGWARATGTPGVAVVTGGPGHTNAVTGAAVAQGAQSPVLVISGQARKSHRERGGNQSLHQADIMRPITKWAVEAEDAQGLPELVMRALLIGSSGTPGAVSLSIPVDVAAAQTHFATAGESAELHASRGRGFNGTQISAPSAGLDAAANVLAAARKPVIVLGGNPFQHAPHDALREAVRQMGIPTFTNAHARGVVPDDGDCCFGFASPLFNAMFREAASADVWLIVGTTVDYNIASVVSADAKVIQVHRDARRIGVGRVPQEAMAGDSAATLTALARTLSSHSVRWNEWRSHCRAAYRKQQAYWIHLAEDVRSNSAGIHPAWVCGELKRHWNADVTLVVDVGDFVNWPKACFPALSPAHYMDGGELGNLGGALPIAIGAQMARPAFPVWVFSGDGGFGFHGWELSMAAERNLPLKIIVGNDHAWGTEKRLQRVSYGRDVECDLPAIRYDQFAALQGVRGLYASTRKDLPAAIAELIACDGPCLLNVELQRLAGRPYAGMTT